MHIGAVHKLTFEHLARNRVLDDIPFWTIHRFYTTARVGMGLPRNESPCIGDSVATNPTSIRLLSTRSRYFCWLSTPAYSLFNERIKQAKCIAKSYCLRKRARSKSHRQTQTKRPGRGKSLHCLVNSVTVRVTSSHPTNYTSCPPREAAPCEAPPVP